MNFKIYNKRNNKTYGIVSKFSGRVFSSATLYTRCGIYVFKSFEEFNELISLQQNNMFPNNMFVKKIRCL